MSDEPKFDLSIADERLKGLNKILLDIIGYELDQGNSIYWIETGGWSEVDLCITLARPFARGHLTEPLEFYRNEDPHYALTESYLHRSQRQAVEAPYELTTKEEINDLS